MLRCYKLHLNQMHGSNVEMLQTHLNQKHVSNVEMLQTTSGSEACAQCWDVTNYIWIRSMWAMLRCYKLHPGQKHVRNVEMLQTTFGSEACEQRCKQWSMWAMLRCYKLHLNQKHVSNVEMLQTTSGSEACAQCWDVTNYIRTRSMWACWDAETTFGSDVWAMLRCYKLHPDQKHVRNVEMLQTTFGSEACEQCWDVTNYIRVRSMWAMLRCYKLHSDQKHVSNVEMLQTTFKSEACEQCWDVTNYI